MFAVRTLALAGKEGHKGYLPRLGAPYYTYVKNQGARSVNDRAREAENRLREVVVRAREVENRGRETCENVQKSNAEFEAWQAMMGPLRRVVVAARLRFFYNYGRSTGRAMSKGATVEQWAIRATHNGYFITDLALMRRGDIKDALIFYELYGIPYENAEPYTKSKTMVAVINQRATMLAHPGRSSKKWDQKRQLQFEKRIWNFANPSSKLGEKCHDLQPLLSPFTEAGNHLVDSRSLGQPAGRRNANKDGLPEDEAGFYNQIGQTSGGATAIAFLEELRTSFPQFVKKRKGGLGQPDAEEWYPRIISQLKQKQRIGLGGECFPTWHSFIDKDLSGQMVSTLRCDEEPQDKPLTGSVQTFLNLNYQISSSSNHLLDGLLAGLSAVIPKYSPILGRYASYTKTSRITRLPRYLTCLFVPVHRNREINKRVKCNPKVIFPFELDATEFCTEVLRHSHSPVPHGLQDLRKDATDCNRAGGPLENLKSSTSNPNAVAGGVVPTNRFGAARSPLGSPAEEEKNGEVATKSKEANLGDGEQWLIEPNHVISQEEGCNLSGLYELIGVITHEGTCSGSRCYSSYVKKGGGEDLWWYYRGEGVAEVPRHRIKTMADAGASHNPLVLLYRAVPRSPAPV